MTDSILSVRDLAVEFDTFGGVVKAVRNVSFDLTAGQTLAIVGESGCGKSVTVQSLMGLIPMPPGRITHGRASFKDQDLLSTGARGIRGHHMGMIFQDPMTSLNPTMRIGDQIAETLVVHKQYSRKHAQDEAVSLLARTHIPEPGRRANQYPFEFSGGMLQRAMIAQALACEPAILIADEPTTALDVTIQAQILELMQTLQQDNGMSIILITHDLAVVARMADQVAVMYAGEIVETGSVEDIFYQPAHPYNQGLQQAMTSNQQPDRVLSPIPGSPPDLFSPPKGCGYCQRCPHAMSVCAEHPPYLTAVDASSHQSRCWLHHELAPVHNNPVRRP